MIVLNKRFLLACGSESSLSLLNIDMGYTFCNDFTIVSNSSKDSGLIINAYRVKRVEDSCYVVVLSGYQMVMWIKVDLRDRVSIERIKANYEDDRIY